MSELPPREQAHVRPENSAQNLHSSDPNCLMQEGLKAFEKPTLNQDLCTHRWVFCCWTGRIHRTTTRPFENACTESEGMSAHTFLTRSFLMQPLSTLWTTSPAARRKLKQSNYACTVFLNVSMLQAWFCWTIETIQRPASELVLFVYRKALIQPNSKTA